MLTWTRKKEWGSEGMTHRASVTVAGVETKMQVLSPRAGYWTLTAWADEKVSRYREASTMRDAKQLAEDYVTELESAARTEAVEQAGAVVGAAIEDMQRELAAAEPVIRGCAAEFRRFAEQVIESYAAPLRDITPEDWAHAAELLDSLGIEHCDCPTPLHTMRCGAGGHVAVARR